MCGFTKKPTAKLFNEIDKIKRDLINNNDQIPLYFPVIPKNPTIYLNNVLFG